VPNPVTNPKLYDCIILAGVKSPGVCKFNGLPQVDEGWTKQEPKGNDGGETTRKGRGLLEFGVTLKLIKDPSTGRDDFAQWPAFREVLKTPIKKNDQRALDIYHPILEGLDISSVVVAKWGPGEPMPDASNTGLVQIDFLQYSPPKKTSGGKPKGSKGPGQGGDGAAPDPNADIKAELEQATQEFNDV
jgi:hypothetical protein